MHSGFTWTYDSGADYGDYVDTSGVTSGSTTNDSTIALRFAASEAATGFVAGDITVSGGSLSSFTAVSSTVYTATFTPSGAGATTVDVAASQTTRWVIITVLQPSLHGPMTMSADYGDYVDYLWCNQWLTTMTRRSLLDLQQ